MKWTISVNGVLGNENTAVIPALDRGFLFGDSVYEVTSTLENCLLFWEDHYERLVHSASGIGFTPSLSIEELFLEVKKTIQASHTDKDIYVRTIVTRGASVDIGLLNKTELSQNVVVLVQELPTYPDRLFREGVRLHIAESVQRNPRKALDPNLKTGNYLNSIMAIQEAHSRGFDDALMVNASGLITEGTTFNVWGIHGKKVITPPLDAGLLLGITRKHLLSILPSQDFQVSEEPLTPKDLLHMDEVFISGSIRGVMPVGQLGEKKFTNLKSALKIRELYHDHEQLYASEKTKWKVIG